MLAVARRTSPKLKEVMPPSWVFFFFNILIDGNYAITIDQNSQAISNNCIATGLEPDSSRYAWAIQKGDFLILSQIIELCTGRSKDRSQ